MKYIDMHDASLIPNPKAIDIVVAEGKFSSIHSLTRVGILAKGIDTTLEFHRNQMLSESF
jgi:hypothetical protein